MYKLNEQAPEFTLLNQEEKPVSLADFKGKKVLLYFYPRALTPGCTTQACALTDVKTKLAEKNVVVLGVSGDKPEKLQKFIAKYGLSFDLLSDPDHAICEKYGVWQLKKFMGKENMGIVRTSFLIDEKGNLLHVFTHFKTKDHHKLVLDYLDQIKA